MAALSKTPPKVLLVANTTWYLYNFRRTLARHLKKNGYEPVFVSPASEYSKLLEKEGFRCIDFYLDRAGINPFRELITLFTLYRIYDREKPEVVHHFTIKCVLLGTLSAMLAGVPKKINAITGIGHFLTGESLRARLLKPFISILYRVIMRVSGVKIIFQNPDDREVFTQLKIASPEQSFLVRSSGVDLKHFDPAHGKSALEKKIPTILFGGRLLVEKGIRDLVEAADILKSHSVRAVFKIAGAQDPGNPSSISNEELASWKKNESLNFLGHQSDMVSLLASSDIVVLPSYREGVPKILLEASAMEKAIVATDVPGCREIVKDGVNGYLVPLKNGAALAVALESLILNQELREKMGKSGREMVIKEFDANAVAEQTMDVYKLFPLALNQF